MSDTQRFFHQVIGPYKIPGEPSVESIVSEELRILQQDNENIILDIDYKVFEKLSGYEVIVIIKYRET